VLEGGLAVPCHDARALLPTVLKGVEPEVRQSRRGMAAGHAEYAALLVKHTQLLSGRDSVENLFVGVYETTEILPEPVLVHDLPGRRVVEPARIG